MEICSNGSLRVQVGPACLKQHCCAAVSQLKSDLRSFRRIAKVVHRGRRLEASVCSHCKFKGKATFARKSTPCLSLTFLAPLPPLDRLYFSELGVNADAPYVVGPDGQVRSLESRKMPVLRTVDARSKKATIRTSVSPTGEFIAK